MSTKFPSIQGMRQFQSILHLGLITKTPVRFLTPCNQRFGYNSLPGVNIFELEDGSMVVMSEDHPLAIHFRDLQEKADPELKKILLEKCKTFLVRSL